MAKRETIIYNGQKYNRYPESNRRHLRVYYWKHDKWKEPPVALHRQVWMDNYGEIPPGYHIHHKDGNTENNSIENLECISPKDHVKKHPMSEEALQRARERGLRENKLAKWQKENPELARKLHEENGKKSQGLKKWKESNPELFKELCRINGKKSAEMYPELRKNNGKKLREWHKNNPELSELATSKRIETQRKKRDERLRAKLRVQFNNNGLSRIPCK